MLSFVSYQYLSLNAEVLKVRYVRYECVVYYQNGDSQKALKSKNGTLFSRKSVKAFQNSSCLDNIPCRFKVLFYGAKLFLMELGLCAYKSGMKILKCWEAG